MRPLTFQCLAPNVALNKRPNGEVSFDTSERGSLTIRPPSRSLLDALSALSQGLSESDRAAFDRQPDFDQTRFEYYLNRLRKRRMLELCLRAGEEDLAVIVPHRETFALEPSAAPDVHRTRLSRFAYMRRTNRGAVLESPEVSCSIVLAAGRTMEWLYDLASAAKPLNVAASEADERSAFVDLLWRCGFLEPNDAVESDARASWEFHDLLFHRASRPGRVLWPVGGSFRFKDRFESPPAVKPRMGDHRIDLATPDKAALSAQSGRTFDVMERRRSFRAMGSPPISLAQIAEFLFRAARFVNVVKSPLQETAKRAFPSGGAIHEIEVYLSVRECDGLDPGFYHYHAFDHALDRIGTADREAAAIVAQAGEDWHQPAEPPQVVLTLASRVPRIAWKYDTVAYRATLINAGAAIQTMYLVATDMNLGCAPAGRGDPAMFASATGLDPLAETSIAEFGLGSRDPGRQARMDEFESLFETRRR